VEEVIEELGKAEEYVRDVEKLIGGLRR